MGSPLLKAMVVTEYIFNIIDRVIDWILKSRLGKEVKWIGSPRGLSCLVEEASDLTTPFPSVAPKVLKVSIWTTTHKLCPLLGQLEGWEHWCYTIWLTVALLPPSKIKLCSHLLLLPSHQIILKIRLSIHSGIAFHINFYLSYKIPFFEWWVVRRLYLPSRVILSLGGG